MKIGELEKEAEEQAHKKYPIPLIWNELDLTRTYKYEEGYIDGARSKENQIKELESELRRVSLNEQLAINNGKNFLKQIADLEAQIGRMKCCENCNNYQHRIDHRCNTECKSLSAWEIKEK